MAPVRIAHHATEPRNTPGDDGGRPEMFCRSRPRCSRRTAPGAERQDRRWGWSGSGLPSIPRLPPDGPGATSPRGRPPSSPSERGAQRPHGHGDQDDAARDPERPPDVDEQLGDRGQAEGGDRAEACSSPAATPTPDRNPSPRRRSSVRRMTRRPMGPRATATATSSRGGVKSSDVHVEDSGEGQRPAPGCVSSRCAARAVAHAASGSTAAVACARSPWPRSVAVAAAACQTRGVSRPGARPPRRRAAPPHRRRAPRHGPGASTARPPQLPGAATVAGAAPGPGPRGSARPPSQPFLRTPPRPGAPRRPLRCGRHGAPAPRAGARAAAGAG